MVVLPLADQNFPERSKLGKKRESVTHTYLHSTIGMFALSNAQWSFSHLDFLSLLLFFSFSLLSDVFYRSLICPLSLTLTPILLWDGVRLKQVVLIYYAQTPV